MTHDVFLSYSSKNKTIANAVCAKLEESGIRVWIAPRDVPAGSNFAGSIVDAIDGCKVLILIWSAHANVSKHILNEISQAFDKGIPIIPFRIQDVLPTSAMSYYISNTHWLDAIDPPLENHIGKLKSSIMAILGEDASDQVHSSPSIDGINSLGSTEVQSKQDQVPESPRGKWRRLWPLFAVGTFVIALILVFFSGLFGISPATGIADFMATDTPTPTKTARPTSTPRPTNTPRPTPTLTPVPDWLASYAEPIFTEIQEREPLFQDDFSDLDPRWGYQTYGRVHSDVPCPDPTSAEMQIQDSSLICSISPDCPQSNLYLSNLELVNFVWQADIDMKSTTGTIELSSPCTGTSAVNFSVSNEVWQFMLPDNNQGSEISRGSLSLHPSSTSLAVTIINQPPYYLVYVNSRLLVAENTMELCQLPGSVFVNMWNENDLENSEFFQFDNVKIWALDTFK
jgi:hypothetical protein